MGISVMALHLFFWKYAPRLSGEVIKIYPDFLGGNKLILPLPVGISFFTLQGIAYLIDFARGAASFIPFKEYTLFKSFFAQLVAGPIVRVHELLPQLRKLRTPSLDDISIGLSFFCMGFFKKIMIADRCAPLVNQAFANPGAFSRQNLIIAVLGYAAQIWADFSGYTDMGRGVARILGIHLPENFLSPYLEKSSSEFWTRWHITLSQWIRDYIYIPMGGNRGSRFHSSLTLLAAMAISGVWHGANWTFLIWGLYHGLLLIGQRAIRWSGLQSFINQSFLWIPSNKSHSILILKIFLLRKACALLCRNNIKCSK